MKTKIITMGIIFVFIAISFSSINADMVVNEELKEETVLVGFSVISEIDEKGIFGRTHIRAIGNNFHICDDDGGLYGHIFIGFKGFKLVFNEDIVIPEENIRWIVMTKNTLNCVYKEE